MAALRLRGAADRLGTVRLANKLGILALSALLFAAPTMACLLSTAELTAAERECCKQMADQCGSAGMPSSHSCCQQLSSPADSSFVVSHSQIGLGDLATAGSAAIQTALWVSIPSPAAHGMWFDEIHGPPESPPVSTSVLRI